MLYVEKTANGYEAREGFRILGCFATLAEAEAAIDSYVDEFLG